MTSIANARHGSVIKYVGRGFSFCGLYTCYEQNLLYPDLGKEASHSTELVIFEIIGHGTPIALSLDKLNPTDWQLVKR